MECDVLPNGTPLPYIVNCIYYVLSMASASTWFFYTEIELNSVLMKRKRFMLITSLPILILLVMLIISGKTGCLFYFDENGIFIRGPLNLIVFILPCLYLLAAIFHATYRAFKKSEYANRKNYLNLAGFALITASACFLQIYVPGTPLPCIGISMAVLFAYMKTQELFVSLDPLTKLSNRYQMVRYLTHKMEHINGQLFLLILDIDNFKQINDTYGHVEGDRALINLASVLRKASSAFNCFAARYGGDEFIIIQETETERGFFELKELINTELNELNENLNKEYDIKISIGHAKYSEDIRYVPDFIARADKSLYVVKRKKHRR